MVLHAIRRSDEAYKLICKKVELQDSALKQWKSNIPSIDYYAIIIVVYYKK